MFGARVAGRLANCAAAKAKVQHRLATIATTAAPPLGFALGAAGCYKLLVAPAGAASLGCEVSVVSVAQSGVEGRGGATSEAALANNKSSFSREEEQEAPKAETLSMRAAPAPAAAAEAPDAGALTLPESPALLPTAGGAAVPPEARRSDFTYMLQAVRRDGTALQYASEELSRDRSLVLEAVRRNGHALAFAAPELKRDRGLVIEAVKSSGLALQFAADELRADRECVLEAIRESGWAMQFASPELQQDEELRQDGGMGWQTGGY